MSDFEAYKKLYGYLVYFVVCFNGRQFYANDIALEGWDEK